MVAYPPSPKLFIATCDKIKCNWIYISTVGGFLDISIVLKKSMKCGNVNSVTFDLIHRFNLNRRLHVNLTGCISANRKGVQSKQRSYKSHGL